MALSLARRRLMLKTIAFWEVEDDSIHIGYFRENKNKK